MKKLIIALTVFLTASAAAAGNNQCNIVPKNDLYINIKDAKPGSITEKEFNDIIDKVEGIYKPIIADRGKSLVVERKWDDGTVNAYAQQSGNTWKVSMFGGLARHETITSDAFALVVCHEIGHHIGGLPKKSSWWGSSWASNEGQSDYFGTSKCLRKYMEKDDNVALMGKEDVPKVVVDKCKLSFSDKSQQAMCQRGSMAGLSLGNLFRDLRKLPEALKFSTPDTNVVSATNHNHPAPQCRLDTYFNGALCDKDAYEDVSDTDAVTGVCVRTDGYEQGVRPLCWYKP